MRQRKKEADNTSTRTDNTCSAHGCVGGDSAVYARHMGWFRKKANSEARDPDLPLSVAQAQRLRAVAREAWAAAGREVSVLSDHVKDADGNVFGLWNLATLVADAPERQWPQLVGDHVRRITTPAPSIDALTAAELHEQLVLRVLEKASLPDLSLYPSAPPLVGDLLQVLVLDFPHTVLTPPESALTAQGDLDEWRAVGGANLWRLMRSEPREHEVLRGKNGGDFHVLLGDSFFTASMAVFLPELISMVGQEDLGRGVLVALPFRHQVAFRVVDGPDAALALQNLFMFAIAGYDQGAGPVSPHVFWVKDGRWEQVTERDETTARIMVGTELAEALGVAEG